MHRKVIFSCFSQEKMAKYQTNRDQLAYTVRAIAGPVSCLARVVYSSQRLHVPLWQSCQNMQMLIQQELSARNIDTIPTKVFVLFFHFFFLLYCAVFKANIFFAFFHLFLVVACSCDAIRTNRIPRCHRPWP